MLDDDAQNDTLNGRRRCAASAAAAINTLLPNDTTTIVDLGGGGTGAIAAELNTEHRSVIVIDTSAGMLSHSTTRAHGQYVQADATELPLLSNRVDAITCVRLLHLLPADAASNVLAQAARALRPGGRLIVTVTTNQADNTSDIDHAIAALHTTHRHIDDIDDIDSITAIAAEHGLSQHATATFTATGQGTTPRHTAMALSRRFPDASPRLVLDAAVALARLPEQDRPRPEPQHTLLSLVKD